MKNLSSVPLWHWALGFGVLFALGAFIFGALLRLWRAHRPSGRTIIMVTTSFVTGIALTILFPWFLRDVLGRLIIPEHRWEVARLASPDGTVDAVMEGSGCGALCSDTYMVAVVPKGGEAPTDVEHYAFSADDMVEAQLHWKEPHLLEIVYKKAFINNFRNVVYPFAKFGDQASWDYRVELRLAPSSPGFSYIEAGANQHK